MATNKNTEIRNDQSEIENFELLEKNLGFEVTPYEGRLSLAENKSFKKLELSPSQKIQVTGLLQQTPLAFTSGFTSSCYVVSFPEGLPHTLTKLKQGGYGSMIQGEHGGFVGSASFYKMTTQAAVLGAFTAMSAVTGQYFLAEINSELELVNKKLDDILEFLYGDKKAELMAEISFVKYAHNNYSTIMMFDEQRIATISSLQDAKKIAMKDIDFYLNDLYACVNEKTKDYKGLQETVKRAERAKQCAEISRQLYVVSGLLEIYFSQNYEQQYLDYVENDMIAYINKCSSSILSDYGKLQNKVAEYKKKLLDNVDNKDKIASKLEEAVTPYKNESDSSIRCALVDSIAALKKKSAYYIDVDGNVYVKNEE